jgi:hypothetical protein
MQLRIQTTGVVLYRIYDADLNVLTTDAECTFDDNQASSTSSVGLGHLIFKNPIYLIAGKTYYISAYSVSGSATSYYRLEFTSSARREHAFPLCYAVSRTNQTGAFTTDNTIVYGITPLIEMNYGLAKDGMTGGILG